MGQAELEACLPVAAACRARGVRCEVYPDKAKMKKQMSYANAQNVPFVAIVGESELAEGKLMLKNMVSGEQKLVAPEELIDIVAGE